MVAKTKKTKKEIVVLEKTTSAEISTSVNPRTLSQILDLGATGLQDEFIPLAEKVRDASKALNAATKMGDLEESSRVVEKMSSELHKLKKPSFLERLPFFGGQAHQKQILLRKSVLEVLDEVMLQYRNIADKLRDNISKVEDVENSAILVMSVLDETKKRLMSEQELLESAIKENKNEDVYFQNNLKNRLNEYKATLSNLVSFRGTQYMTVVNCQAQKSIRAMLYTTMTNLAPQVETLAHQQMAMISSQNEVATAVRINTAAIEGVRVAVHRNAQMMRQNAEDVAAAAYMPIIDEATHEATKQEILGMIKNVGIIIENALIDGKKAADKAEECERDINAQLKSIICGEIPQKSLPNNVKETTHLNR